MVGVYWYTQRSQLNEACILDIVMHVNYFSIKFREKKNKHMTTDEFLRKTKNT